MTTNWFMTPVGTHGAAVRLFCLPYAGGSAAVYRPWMPMLLPDVEVVSVQLSGRGWRLREAPAREMSALADALAVAIADEIAGPFAVFGHSMGSWLGLEVVRRLEAAGHRPMCFFASGRQAPSLGCTRPPLSHLSNAAFVDEVQAQYGGIPPEIAREPDLLELLLPALRADIELLEGHRCDAERRIETAIHALVGASDTVVSVDEVQPWSEATTGPFELTVLPGGHFYFQPDPRDLLHLIHKRLVADLALADSQRSSHVR